MVFLLKLGSRRQWNEERGCDQFEVNVALFFHCSRVVHGDNVDYFFRSLQTQHLHMVRLKLVHQLRCRWMLNQFRQSSGYLLLVVDGTGMLHFAKPYREHCLSQRLSNGQRVYSPPVLEAKTVRANGLVVSLGSKLLVNEEGADRQDCELKAFYRLATQIKRDFPQLRLCLVPDSLYTGELKLFQSNDRGIKMMGDTFRLSPAPCLRCQRQAEACRTFWKGVPMCSAYAAKNENLAASASGGRGFACQ
ncbi:MAG: hypothetical protein RML74_03060 [Acidobacteriota bacterium]|nr:hypothetical protein [Blastocatellia bacterium]MDW8167456.1 hypothetical protein [Acidobacteriota bacterium]MDW8256803.1 hypothetical protein [Acidobacteriota bacterium]